MQTDQVTQSDPQISPQTEKSAELFLSVVVPIRNVQAQLHAFYKKLSQFLDQEFHPEAWEMIFVDNLSSDDSFKLVTKLASQDARIKACQLSKNYGPQKALLCAYRISQGQVILQMDCDPQCVVEMIPSFLEEWRKGFSVIHGVRSLPAESALGRRLQKMGQSFFKLLTGKALPMDAWNFRLLDRDVIEKLKKEKLVKTFLVGQIHQMGFKQIGVSQEQEVDQFSEPAFDRQWWKRGLELGIQAFFDSPLGIIRLYGFLGCALLGSILIDWLFRVRPFAVSLAAVEGLVLLVTMVLHGKKIYEQLTQAGEAVIEKKLNFSKDN